MQQIPEIRFSSSFFVLWLLLVFFLHSNLYLAGPVSFFFSSLFSIFLPRPLSKWRVMWTSNQTLICILMTCVSSSYKLRDWLGLKYYESHFFLFTWFYHSHLFQISPHPELNWTEHRGARTNANRLLRRSAETIALIKMAFTANEAESNAGKRSNILTSLSLPPLAKSTSSHIIRKNAPFFNCEE